MTTWSNRVIADGKKIALVPTMGYFHNGHASLMQLAKQHADLVVVSLFVNPIQFGVNEDLARYPRNSEGDAARARQEKVDIIFTPTVEDIYPEGFDTRVMPGKITENLCGRTRPGHFEGVATVVAKLFNIIKPRVAVFGEKDLQQLAVIRKMTEDLNWDIDIRGHPIVRETDGLAMSSRNTYLATDERLTALCLYQSIQYARQLVQTGHQDTASLIDEITKQIESQPGTRIDYVSIVDNNDLLDQERVDENSVLALAVYVGRTRLIDNGRLLG